jgi:DNA-binding MarR family transcriptional regulator
MESSAAPTRPRDTADAAGPTPVDHGRDTATTTGTDAGARGPAAAATIAADGTAGAAAEPPLGELLSRAARAIHLQSRELLAPLGLTPAAARALRTLGHAHGPMRMVDLAERMHVVPRTVTTLVDALEADDLIERRADPNDRRSTQVHLTERGVERLEQMRSARREAAGELLSALSQDEQEQLRGLLVKLDLDRVRPRC